MITTALLTLTIAAGVVPLIQRDLRIAHARIEARRCVDKLPPVARAIIQAVRSMGESMDRFVLGTEAFNAAVRAGATEADRRRIRKALRRRARRPLDRRSIR